MVRARFVVICAAMLAGSACADSNGKAPQAKAADAAGLEKAIFATGCFWCTESDFEKLDGVSEAVSGYIGGTVDHPTYEQIGTGTTGHTEAVEILFDPEVVSYETLLEHFWRTHDPYDGDGQFCDQGDQYRPGVFYLDDTQKRAAERSLADAQKVLDKPIQTRLYAASTFWPAEDYHQDYYKRNTFRYKYYRKACRRDDRVAEVWGKKN